MSADWDRQHLKGEIGTIGIFLEIKLSDISAWNLEHEAELLLNKIRTEQGG